MTELSLYTFIESHVNAISAIQSRFLVVEGGAGDLNADNSDDAIIGNSVNQTKWAKKYPCAVLMPPREVGRNRQKNTTRFQLTMYFLTTTYADGMNATKSINVQTNTSKVSIKEDWSQMKSAAEDFMATMRNTFYTDLTVLDYIRPVKSNEEFYERVTLANNDRLSGIRLIFELDVVIGCGAFSGNVPTWPTPEPSCGVCSPGEADQVWATSEDGNSVGWRTVTFGGGGGFTNVEITGSYKPKAGDLVYIGGNSLSKECMLDLGSLIHEGDEIWIINRNKTWKVLYTGQPVYDAFDNVVELSYFNSNVYLRFVAGKIIIMFG